MWNKEVSSEIDSLSKQFSNLKNSQTHSDGVVNLNNIDELNTIKNSIASLKTALSDLLKRTEEIESSCNKDYEKYIKDLREAMRKRGIISDHKDDVDLNTQKSEDWTLVGNQKKKHTERSQLSAWSQPLATKVQQPKFGNVTILQKGETQITSGFNFKIDNVPITEKLYIPHVRILEQLPSARDIKEHAETGQLYYATSADTFFMILNPGGVLIYGNIGEITAPIESPQRVKDCKYFPCRHDNCCFYHDPFKYSGRSDHRNYINGSWDYVGAMSGQKRQGEQSRIIGSHSSLEVDIQMVNAQSMEIYCSQIMHDILVYLLCASTQSKV